MTKIMLIAYNDTLIANDSAEKIKEILNAVGVPVVLISAPFKTDKAFEVHEIERRD